MWKLGNEVDFFGKGGKLCPSPNLRNIKKKAAAGESLAQLRGRGKFFWYSRQTQTPAIKMLISSAIGIAIHRPFTPHIFGRRRIPRLIKTNVRNNDKIADVFPSDKAVNRAEAKILNPAKRNKKEKSRKPLSAIEKTRWLLVVKIPTIMGAAMLAIRKIITEHEPINAVHIFMIALIFTRSRRP